MTLPAEFRLTYNKSHFEEIYFQDHRLHLLKSPSVKTPLYGLLGFSLVFICLSSSSIQLTATAFVMLWIVWSILFLNYVVFACILLFKSFSVYKWLKREDQYDHYSVRINDRLLELRQDDKITAQTWSEVTFYQITENFCFIEGKTTFLFVKKAFEGTEWETFRSIAEKQLRGK